jgi:hypothetical protein
VSFFLGTNKSTILLSPESQTNPQVNSMKQKILKLTPEAFIRTLEGKPAQLNLPADLELIDIKYDAYNKQVTAIVRSESFEDVAENQPIPELTVNPPAQTQLPTPAPVVAPAAVPSPVAAPKPPATAAPQRTIIQSLTASTPHTTTSSSGVKTLGPKPDSGQDTCGFEGEFTKEQRKVLKFASDGDYVIVKPIRFLKTEWEDINDTVKSIGGKWMKGEIIDYWVIPKKSKNTDE